MSVVRLRQAAKESVSGLPREFWWLWTSTLVNRLGGFVATFLAMYLTVDRGYSAMFAGLVGALHGLGGAVSAVVAGVLTDRLGRRPTLLVAQLSTAVTVAVLGFVQDPVAIAVVACLVGMTSNASRPAVQAMIADIVAPGDRVRAFALNYWAINLGFAVSAAAAGLIARHGYLTLFLADAGMTLLCAVIVFGKVPESRPERERAAEGVVADAPEREVGLGAVLRDRRFMAVVALSFLVATLIQQAFVALPVAMGADGLSSTDFGVAIATNGVLIVAVQIPVTRFLEHRDPAPLLMVSALLTGAGFGLTAFAGSVGMYALAVMVWTVGEIINSPTQMGLVARLSPTHGRGRYQGMYTLSWSLASLIAPLAGGAVMDRFGADALWAASAVVGLVAAGGYVALGRALRSRPAAGGGSEGGVDVGADADAGGASVAASTSASAPAGEVGAASEGGAGAASEGGAGAASGAGVPAVGAGSQ
ncbi:MDR family MFS transporter [Streptomyces rapamycinicus]|uniref:Transporter n=2 Tax=Streptomyces rapamycinicus TaxID=1226757 RepID=A0A3L8RLR3_STRRN|nr:MFS transporter [Streptomyces rapamycinicus]MBB4784574.1 MFS family permease [Streptomyces rapamycinicus]RLV79943.1 transporter [Streptomyces rapamycinicus NRRL 5491]UTO64870.1 MFS transporter [Streptomyces rapamycinicus]UTP32825.1 MFS transporter [Streptomyces rapamycinicus NRRL 5491]